MLVLQVYKWNPRLHVPLTHPTHEKDRASKNLSLFLIETAMAIPPKNALYFLLLVSSFILGAMADLALSCPSRCEVELQWTLYARQIGGG